MICSSCGASKPYTNHFDITDASARVTQMLRIFPIPISSSSVVSQMQVDIESDMRHYDLEMSQLQSRLVYLQAKQELLSKHVEQLKSLSAPIRRLPVELLARIFVMVCEEDAITFSLHAQIAWRLPFVLASVCSGWRGVAVATSRLWSNLCTFWTTKPTAPRLEPPLKLCLLRSQNHPLSVELRIEPSEGPDDPTLQMLTEQCSRWKHVTVLNLVEENFPGLSNGRSFPLLETLEITHYDSESEHPDLHLFSSAPRLHTLKINKLPPPETLETFTPCAQITSLTVSCFYDFFEVLNKFSSLKSMIFADVDHSYIPEPEELPLQTLPYVTTVEFQLSDDERLSHECNLLKMFVEKLTLPSLTTLTIGTDAFHLATDMFKGVWPPQTFSDFFQRSGCSLTALHLDYISLPDRELIVLLRLNPSLVELRVKEIRRKDYDFAAVASSDGTIFKFEDIITPLLLTSLHAYNHGLALASPLVPKLERLHFVADGFLFDDELFWKMVMSRWIPEREYVLTIGVSCLKSVKIHVLNRGLQEDVERRLQQLERAGLRVSLTG